MSHLKKKQAGFKAPVIPGVTTFVTPDSKSNLPTGNDREKEQALPPGSATPKSPASNDESKKEHGVEIPKYEFNTPDNDIPDRPRTLPTPGEEYGHPTKFDYNMVTRRSMTAYHREWTPGHRQHRTRGRARLQRRQYYRKNRAAERIRARKFYNRNRHNPQFQKLQAHRRKYPTQHRRRYASVDTVSMLYTAFQQVPSIIHVAEMYLESWKVGPLYPGANREHSQYGPDKVQSEVLYRRKAPKKKRQALKRYYQFCRKNQRCKRKRQLYTKVPHRFERKRSPKKEEPRDYAKEQEQEKKASILTTPQIHFALGPALIPGVVHSVSPMLGAVTFVLGMKDWGPIHSMPVLAFLHSVVFLSENDIDSFFELVDTEIGPEAYADMDPEVLHDCADMFDRDPDDPEFADKCLSTIGEKDYYLMNSSQLSVALDALIWGVEEEREDLYEGEVLESQERIAMETFQYDQQSPNSGEINHPGDNVGYAPSSAKDWVHHPDEKGGLPKGNDLPNKHDDDANAGSSRVVPNGEGQFWSGEETYVKAAATMADIINHTAPEVRARTKGIQVRLKRADPTRGIWIFTVAGSKGQTYTVRLKKVSGGNVKAMNKAHIVVSCSCDFFRYQGPEHWASQQGFLYGKPAGNATTPTVRDPDGKHWACKHILAVFQVASKYRTASMDILRNAIFSPVIGMPSRIAERYLSKNR